MGNEARKKNEETSTSKTAKEGKTYWNPTERKDPKTITADKSNNTTGRNKSKYFDERRKTQTVPRQSQTVLTKKRTFQNNERKFYQLVSGEYSRTNQQPGSKETKQFKSKIWKREEHNRNAKWINNAINQLERSEECRVVNTHLDSLWEILNKILTWKMPSDSGILSFWLKIHVYPWQIGPTIE